MIGKRSEVNLQSEARSKVCVSKTSVRGKLSGNIYILASRAARRKSDYSSEGVTFSIELKNYRVSDAPVYGIERAFEFS